MNDLVAFLFAVAVGITALGIMTLLIGPQHFLMNFFLVWPIVTLTLYIWAKIEGDK